MSLSSGARLGPYEIVAPLGAGGMGEVYRARDSRLGRDVAIKVLPSELSSDAGRLRRFEKEARAASALNHPSIVSIYDVGTEGTVSYIVMELRRTDAAEVLLFAARAPEGTPDRRASGRGSPPPAGRHVHRT
jgi:serine/threonine protein kinase